MRRLTTVRYGSLRLRGLFTVESTEEIKSGDECVVRSARGTEMGVVLAQPIEDGGATQGQNKIGCNESACGSCATSQGSVLRRASGDEIKRSKEQNKLGVMAEVRYAREKSREYRLGLKIVGAEYLFEKEKLILHFASVHRAEFRELIRDLAHKFHTRIELKQIGARDEARLTGDVASCGRELCCRSFLHDLQPVSMRMAKQQKKTLDPTKIAGQCGKLKCCLRYEDEVYVELQKSLPKRNSFVRVEAGIGKVVNVDLLLQKLVIEAENGERKVVHVSELLETNLRPGRPPASGPGPDSGPDSGPSPNPGSGPGSGPGAGNVPPSDDEGGAEDKSLEG